MHEKVTRYTRITTRELMCDVIRARGGCVVFVYVHKKWSQYPSVRFDYFHKKWAQSPSVRFPFGVFPSIRFFF